MLAVTLLLAGCASCRPGISEPDPIQAPPPDTATPPDSPADTVDTGPFLPPRCDLMEVEPNDNYSLVTPIPMEEWVCGELNPADPTHAPLGDVEYFSFTTVQPGWVEVSVEAAKRGSSADMEFVLYDDDDSVTAYSGYLTTDPLMRFPTTAAGTYTVVLGEETYLYGDDYDWYLLASLVKAPVEYTFTETEPNDDATTPNEFAMDNTVYGTVGSVGDFDWYHIVTTADETKVRFTVEAFSKGSPVDMTLVLYKSTDLTTPIRTDHTGEVDYDPDPYFEQKQTEASDWLLLVKNEQAHGSRFHWYTLKIEGITE